MLRFFRIIRKKLVEEQRTRQYIIYAIGEILLVVFGILIALQINNWNEERKLLKDEQYLLVELELEFNTNLSLVQRDYNGNRVTSDAVIHIMSLFVEPEKADPNIIDSLIVTVFNNTSFDPKTGVVDEIISTGRLNVLSDDSLRYLISQWPSVLKNQQEDINIRATHFEQFVLPEIFRNYPIKNSNSFVDFSFWTDSYQRDQLSKSTFEYSSENFFTSTMEGVLYVHSLNQDFILMNDQETEKYIESILKRIKMNQN